MHAKDPLNINLNIALMQMNALWCFPYTLGPLGDYSEISFNIVSARRFDVPSAGCVALSGPQLLDVISQVSPASFNFWAAFCTKATNQLL